MLNRAIGLPATSTHILSPFARSETFAPLTNINDSQCLSAALSHFLLSARIEHLSNPTGTLSSLTVSSLRRYAAQVSLLLPKVMQCQSSNPGAGKREDEVYLRTTRKEEILSLHTIGCIRLIRGPTFPWQ